MSAADIHRVTRRTFLTEVSRGVFAVVILGTGVVAACSTTNDEPSTTSGEETPTSGADPTTSTTAKEPTTTEASAAGGVTVQRIALGNVAAYLLVRGTEAVIVDTGNPGAADDIEAGLSEVGLGWSDVGNVILTHRHPDHVGSLGPVMDNAAQALGYAGEADLPVINAPRPLNPVGDGDTVFGLSIIETPGHTEGSISVYDPIAGVLVVGDAMNGKGGGVPGDASGVTGANPRFTSDMDVAAESIKKLAGLDYGSLYFGHGEPLEGNASQLVAELAGEL